MVRSLAIASIQSECTAAGLRRLCRFIAVCALCASAHAQTIFTIERSVSPSGYLPGDPVDVTLTLSLTTSDHLDSLGVQETLPGGWTYDSIVSGTAPAVTPSMGDGEFPLDFAWFPLPALPVTFTYRVNTPADGVGIQAIGGYGVAFLTAAGEVRTATLSTTVARQCTGVCHSADIDSSGSINLSELLRVIQFYNIGGLHCADFPGDTEDGYLPGALGNKSCGFHNSDYNGPDWFISFNELLRLVQIYNAKGYHACAEGEDAFCPDF